MIYFTSDLHLNNKNIIKYESVSRGEYSTVEEMNKGLIKNWNSKIKEGDQVFVLGDFIMGKAEEVPNFLKQLNGHITLIRGNHDTSAKLYYYQQCGIEVKDIHYLQYKGKFFILNHYPIWNKDFADLVSANNPETYCLYGHLHSHAPIDIKDNMYHVGVDTNKLYPISIDEILEKIEEYEKHGIKEKRKDYSSFYDER